MGRKLWWRPRANNKGSLPSSGHSAMALGPDVSNVPNRVSLLWEERAGMYREKAPRKEGTGG